MEKINKLEVVSVRLVRDAPILSDHKLDTPQDVIGALGDMLRELDREVVCVINLRADGAPINCHFASMGSINESIVSPREIFKSSILSNAAGIILVHNHTSGSLEPSRADISITDKMAELCRMMGIPLADHIIVGGDNRKYFSFREKRMIENPHAVRCTDGGSRRTESGRAAERSIR